MTTTGFPPRYSRSEHHILRAPLSFGPNVREGTRSREDGGFVADRANHCIRNHINPGEEHSRDVQVVLFSSPGKMPLSINRIDNSWKRTSAICDSASCSRSFAKHLFYWHPLSLQHHPPSPSPHFHYMPLDKCILLNRLRLVFLRVTRFSAILLVLSQPTPCLGQSRCLRLGLSVFLLKLSFINIRSWHWATSKIPIQLHIIVFIAFSGMYNDLKFFEAKRVSVEEK